MFVVNKVCGRYDDTSFRTICVCETEEKANEAIVILNEILQFNAMQIKLIYAAKEQYRESFLSAAKEKYGEDFRRPKFLTRPHKSTLDPKDLISQKDWIEKYVKPFNQLLTIGEEQRILIDKQVDECMKNHPPPVIPEKFKPFEKEIDFSYTFYSLEETSFEIEEVILF